METSLFTPVIKLKSVMNKNKLNFQRFRHLIIPILVFLLALVGFTWFKLGNNVTTVTNVDNVTKERVESIKKPDNSVLGDEFNINKEKFSVDPKKLTDGGPPKDGVPSVDKPKFDNTSEGWGSLKAEDVVFGMVYKGQSRAYPQRILTWHEIVNDIIAGDPILITYDPLSHTALAFERKVNGIEVEFGVSGKLYNSNLVMYSRTNEKIPTESLWTQVGGKAIVGDLTDSKLKQLTLDTVSWRNWVKEHPDTKVLSRETGSARDYSSDPYKDYYIRAGVFAPLENEDKRLFEKTIVFGIEVKGKSKVYPEEELKKRPKFTDDFAGKKLQITRNNDGSVRIKNLTDDAEIIPTISFWFSWAAFHPNSEIYQAG